MGIFVKKDAPRKGPSMRAPTTTEKVMNMVGEVNDKVLPGFPLKELLMKLVPSGEVDPTDISSMMNPIVAAGILPKQFLKKFAQENADNAYKHLSQSGYPKIATAVQQAFTRNPRTAAHLSAVGTNAPKDAVASYLPITGKDATKFDLRAVADKMLKGEDIGPDGPTIYNAIRQRGASEEDLARAVKRELGTIDFNPDLERRSPEEIARAVRHEMGHLSDDLIGKLKGPMYPTNDARYWTSRPEVKARAIEHNYVRDMTGKARPQEFRVLEPASAQGPAVTGYRRPHYGGSIGKEIIRGMEKAGNLPNTEAADELAKQTSEEYKPLLDAIRKQNRLW